jgi:glutathione S-transferase
MEVRLGKAAYLAGAFSFADIAFFMAQFFGDRMGAPIGSEYLALTNWRARVACRPAITKVLAPMADFLRSQGRQVPSWILV